MNPATQFYRSQIGDTAVINYCYTDRPTRLLAKDLYYFFVYSWALPWIVWPLWPCPSGELDELYPNLPNLFCLLVHFVLIVLQLTFILSLPFTAIFPLWAGAGFVAAFLGLNWLLCRLLNGNTIEFRSDTKYAKHLPEHEHEQWVFLNGVAVGEHWMKNNVNRLALTFGRPVLGIHNRTSGIIFDVIECLIQRNFSYATRDIRACYKILRDILYDPAKSKVVFILHSQGGIEGGLVLDWLLQEMPQDLLAKLEVYTFGNAANHFNNPHRHAFSQSLVHSRPLTALRTLVTETSYATQSSSPAEADKPTDSAPAPSAPLNNTSSSLSTLSTQSAIAANDRAIKHIEHYAHSTDFVALWGVLHFATNKMGSRELPRFLGRLFARSTGRGGHQLNQHYLDGMFPLRRDPDTGELTGADEENDFMSEVVKMGEEGAAMDNAREAFDLTYAGIDGFGTGEIGTPVEVHGLPQGKDSRHEVTVRDLSRLWRYRNGQSPDEPPPLLIKEGRVVRNATM